MDNETIAEKIFPGCIIWVSSLESDIFIIEDVAIAKKECKTRNIFTLAERVFTFDEILLSKLEIMEEANYAPFFKEKINSIKKEKEALIVQQAAKEEELTQLRAFTTAANAYKHRMNTKRK